ncbi:TPA: type II toxin-antitoxin system prevent-host-death family antitoxin [Providencia stuartii]|nr:type II toxin-antitoxin system prevent-host-death family antitoxin [Providencia stuartii]
MKTISFSDARNNLKSVLDSVVDDADTTIITRRDSEDAVVMSLELLQYPNGNDLLRSPANAEHLNKSIDQFKAGKVKKRELINE